MQTAAGVCVLGGGALRLVAAMAVCLAFAAPSSLRANVSDCRDAISAFNSARSEIASAFRTYGSCVSGSDGHDDCSSEFSTLHSAQDEFESAVSTYESECS